LGEKCRDKYFDKKFERDFLENLKDKFCETIYTKDLKQNLEQNFGRKKFEAKFMEN
jgi:hypothetical protein